MGKRRVYEIAKEFGMKGPELVKVLKDLGFEKYKTHMAVLDDADQMMIEVRLETAGYSKAPKSSGDAEGKGPVLKKKGSPFRKKSAESAAPAAEEAKPSSKKKALTRKSPLKKKEEEVVAEAAPESTTLEEIPETAVEAAPAEEALATQDAPTEPAAATESSAVPTGSTEDTGATPGSTTDADTAPPAEVVAAQDEPAPDTESSLPDTPSLADEDVTPETIAQEAGGEDPTLAPSASDEGSDTPEPVAPEREAREPASSEAVAEGTGEATPAAAAQTAEGAEAPAVPEPEKPIKRVTDVPKMKAKKEGFIELSKDIIADAKARSGGGPRNPASVDRNLRQAALEQFRTRGAKPGVGGRRGPQGPRGPGGPGGRGRKGGGAKIKRDPLAPPPGVDPTKAVQIELPITVKKLSEALGHKVNQLLVVLMKMGVPANINSYLDKDQIELVALELSRIVEVVEEREAEEELIKAVTARSEDAGDEAQVTRPPILTFMGHVDHGKTTLIDALRDSSITKGEAGGITQHIGAYKIDRPEGSIVVLDTPGHAAFTSMRARGAQLTDIVVLVVAADDGVKQQTTEAINHAKAAEVPIVVAINKCDRPGANPMQVKQQLATVGLQPEEWGGNTQFVEVSATEGTGLGDLVEKVLLEAEIMELSSNPNLPAQGTVIEAKQTPAQGNMISLMVMEGTLRRGELVLCGSGTGRIRVLMDDYEKPIDEAGPGTPVEVMGLPELPMPGDKFYVVTNAKMAKEVAETRQAKQRSKQIAAKNKARLDDVRAQLMAQKIEELRLIVKADVMGSLDAINHVLADLSNEEVRINILHSALGGITENDVVLAGASNAFLIGFNSVADEKARQQAEELGVNIRTYSVIYELVDEVRKAMEGMLAPEQKEEIRGHTEIKRIFKSSKFGNLSGCLVLDGTIGRNHKARLTRDGIVVYTGSILSLKREKDDAREVRQNYECGVRLKNYEDVREGDIIETFETIEVKRTLGDVEIKRTIKDQEEAGV